MTMSGPRPCLRASIARSRATQPSLVYRPGGRWERILRALSGGPMHLGDVCRAARDPHLPARVDRARVRRALHLMWRGGYVVPTRDRWLASPHGLAVLDGPCPRRRPA